MTREGNRLRRRRLLFAAGTVLAVAGAVSAVVGAWALLAIWSGSSGSWGAASELRDLALVVGGFLALVAGVVSIARGVGFGRTLPATFLTPPEEARVIRAIRDAEQLTAGEILVHLADHAEGDVLTAARASFDRLGVAKTVERSGVLFFVAVRQRRFAVVGDRGIHERVPEGFWDDVVRRVQQRFAEGKYAEGLTEGIALAGDALARFFPRRPDDINELSDAISRDS